MNPRKLMAVALCAAACVTTTTYAEDKQAGDAPFESAAATPIPDPVNPKPGMLFKGYNLRSMPVSELPSKLTDDVPAITTTIVKSDKFALLENCHQGVWEGFLKCERSAKCTILVKQFTMTGSDSVLFINGKQVASDLHNNGGMIANHVDIKVGFNHIKLFVMGSEPVSVSLKTVESTKDPKQFAPKDLYYDEKPEETKPLF